MSYSHFDTVSLLINAYIQVTEHKAHSVLTTASHLHKTKSELQL